MTMIFIIMIVMLVGLIILLLYALCDAAARSDRITEYNNSLNELQGKVDNYDR